MKNRIVNILNQAKSFYFATVEGDQPRVRPYNVAVEFEDKVYFYTNNHTHAFKQIAVNPKIELCAQISDERWIRVSGKIVFDYRQEAKKAMLDANPELRKMYNEEDKIFEVFYLSNMAAAIHSLHESPEVIC
jgi:uncharacterized pyridoxamine 5'-phosphate oxidase family protein